MDPRRIRMLFALVAAVIFLVLKVVFPGLPFTEEQTVAFFGLIAAYVLGEGIDAGKIRAGLGELFKSWKFISLVAGIVIVVVKAYYPAFPFSEEMIAKVLEAIIVGVGAQGGLAAMSTVKRN